MGKQQKRAAMRLLAAVMSTTLLLGACASKGGETQSGESKAAKDENTLLVALQTANTITDYEKNYLTQYLEEMTGIDIEFYLLPSTNDEIRTKVSLMVTSADDLPDVLITNALLPETILQYGSNGIFLPLNEYVNDAEKMPNFNNIPQEDKELMLREIEMADGNIYGFGQYDEMTWNFTPHRIFINRVWLDKLGLEVPKTTDELKEVLIAFRDQDPNGNGLKDEIGVYGRHTGSYGVDVVDTLMNAFVYTGFAEDLTLDESGTKVIAPCTTEEWKQGLLYLNDLYREGLLSPAIFTDDDIQFKATLNEDTNVVGFVSTGSLSSYTDAENNKNFLEMEMIEPLTGPEGVCWSPYNQPATESVMFVFSNTEKVDLAVKLADAFYDPVVCTITRYGKVEEDWTRDPEVLKTKSNSYVKEGVYDSVTLALKNDIWAWNTDSFWRCINPRYYSVEENDRVSDAKELPADSPVALKAKSKRYYVDKHPQYILPNLKYTEDETLQIQEAITNLPDYIDQATAEFITGARDIESGWETYLEELDNMGLSQWLTCAQAAYERSQK